MTTKKPYFKLLLLSILLGNFFCVFGQSTDEKKLYTWYDKQIGTENESLNNGAVHLNYDKTVHQENRYFEDTKEYQKGEVTYQGQRYYDTYILYDIFRDEIVFNPNRKSSHLNFEIQKEEVSQFEINKTRFVNMSLMVSFPKKFKNGFYEEALVRNDFSLYIKHYKIRKTILETDGTYFSYAPENEYILQIKNNFYPVNSKSEIIKLFPQLKKNINDFYELNGFTEKENKIKFMKTLMNTIHELLQKN